MTFEVWNNANFSSHADILECSNSLIKANINFFIKNYHNIFQD